MDNVIVALEGAISDAEIDYQVSGSHLTLNICSPIFKVMSRIERQRFVKKILAPFIDSGQVHAVILKVGVRDE